MTATSLRSKDLLGIESLSPEEIALILDTAETMRSIGERPIKKVPALRGRMVVNLFFESSTRTRFSFETAEKWLSADSLSFAANWIIGSYIGRLRNFPHFFHRQPFHLANITLQQEWIQFNFCTQSRGDNFSSLFCAHQRAGNY